MEKEVSRGQVGMSVSAPDRSTRVLHARAVAAGGHSSARECWAKLFKCQQLPVFCTLVMPAWMSREA